MIQLELISPTTSTRMKRATRRLWRGGWFHVGALILIGLALGTYMLEVA